MFAETPIVGLDFSDDTLRAVWLKQGGRGHGVVKFKTFSLGPTEDRISTFYRWIQRRRIDYFPCVMALSGKLLVFRSVPLPADDPRSPEQIIGMELRTLDTSDSVTDMQYQFSFFEWKPGYRQALLALVRSDAVTQHLQEAEAFRVGLYGLVPSPVAFYNAMVATLPNDTTPTLLLRIGSENTDMAIGTHRGLLFARSLACGSNREPEALGSIADIYGLYLKKFPPVRGIIVSGDPVSKDMLNHIGRHLNLPIVYSAPALSNLPAEFALAYGLALSVSPNKSTCPISFLPSTVRDETLLRLRKPFWSVAAISFILTLVLMLIYVLLEMTQERSVMEQEARNALHKQEAAAAHEAFVARETYLRNVDGALLDTLRFPSLVRRTITLVKDTLPPSDWATSIQSGNAREFIVEGITAQKIPDAFNTWVATLKASPETELVELLDTHPVLPGSLINQPKVAVFSHFTVRIVLTPTPTP